MFLNRINLRHDTNYTVDNLIITIHTNLPSMTDEHIEQMMKLNGILSDQTIITNLGYDYETEKHRKENEINDGVANATATIRKINEEDGQKEGSNITGTERTSTNDKGTGKNVQSDVSKNDESDDSST